MFPQIVSNRYFHVQTRPKQAQSMTAVATHPMALRYRGITSLPITFRLDAITMMTAISGAATTPFNIAAQNSAFTGSICMKLSESPIRVATAIAA